MRGWLTGTALAVLLTTATPAVAQMPAEPVLQLSFDADGRVTLTAHHVTARDILAEWARQCGCLVVNAARLNSAPLAVPVHFEQAEQSRVLESLLREAAGYVLTPKRAGSQSASDYETIYILATTNPVPAAYVPQPPPGVPMGPQPPTTGSPDDELPPVTPGMPMAEPQAPQAPEPPPSSNPFGSRTGGRNPFDTDPAPTAPVPGAPAPQQPRAPGRAVPIVPAPPSGQ